MNKIPSLLWCMAAVVLAGCQDQEIRHYQAAKEDTAPLHASATGKQTRLLAVIAPRQDRTWFFKLVGKAPDIEDHREEFHQFITSLHFTDGGAKPITWTLPEGWQEEPATNQMRYATLRLGPTKSSPELLVTPLGPGAGSLLANVNRWRKLDLGLPEIGEAELGKLSQDLKIDGAPGTLVDMTGPGGKGNAMMPPFMAGSQAPGPEGNAEASPPLTYTIPDGWQELPHPGDFALIGFQVSDGSHSATVKVTPFQGMAGGLTANVNRWRKQINLDNVGEEQLLQDLHQIDVAGKPSPYVDMTGPGTAGGESQRMLGVMTLQGDQSWFFTMKGPADLIGKQKSAFEGFLKSVKFTRGTGANHG